MITIVGLGPGDPELITRRAWALLTTSAEVWVRTCHHPAVSAVAAHTQVHSYDHLYEQHHDFAAVYDGIAADVLARAAAGDVVYAVPGDPSVAEATTLAIRSLAEVQGVLVTIMPGVSFLEPTFSALAQDPIQGVQMVDATTLAASFHPTGSTQQGMLVVQLYSRFLAGDVKLTLMNAYPDEHSVTLVSGAGTDKVRVHVMPLYELDRHEHFDDLTTLWVPALTRPSSYDTLQEIIAHLRAPDGCPWDREQTHESLRPYLLEESYEVLEALDQNDTAALSEELGDLLIQVALHVQIATEDGEFMLSDVIGHVVEKLVRRHPHVFSDVEVVDSADVTRNWEAIKQAERKQNDGAQKVKKKTMLDGISKSLPALAQAQTYVERLARVGYPLPSLQAMDEAELGQALLKLVEQAEVAGVDAESALRHACEVLRTRLQTIEAGIADQDGSLLDLDPQQQRIIWEQHLSLST